MFVLFVIKEVLCLHVIATLSGVNAPFSTLHLKEPVSAKPLPISQS